MKEHAIIEKTAKFISTQGAQMEILIKTKQSNNPQFDFLNQNNLIYPYYRHVLNSFKNGTYPSEDKLTANSNLITNDQKTEEFNFNHFTKESSTFANLYTIRPNAPIITYRPSADCSYTQLISKIKGVPLPSIDGTTTALKSPLVTPPIQLKNDNNTINQQKISIPKASPVAAITTPPITAAAATVQNSDGVEVKKLSSGLMLAQYYNSDSETEQESDNDDDDGDNSTSNNINNDSKSNDDQSIDFPFPPESLQNIIDKTASYVIKNGKSFEDILRTKDNQRFSFLDNTNEFHRYYLYKVTGRVPKKIKINDNCKTVSSNELIDNTKPKIISKFYFRVNFNIDFNYSFYFF